MAEGAKAYQTKSSKGFNNHQKLLKCTMLYFINYIGLIDLKVCQAQPKPNLTYQTQPMVILLLWWCYGYGLCLCVVP